MIVTDPDIVIADYAVKSYVKLKGIPFRLRVYSNWVSSKLKEKYFPRWRRYDFAEIIENEWQTDDKKPSDSRLEGPFEKCTTIWDRELKKIRTPYHATVDADFEILDASFIPVMLRQLDATPNLIAMSTDYSPLQPEYYDSYSGEIVRLNERWHTWFCIYKREALQCTVSHRYYEEMLPGSGRRNIWDSSGYFQKALKDMGYELAVLDPQYRRCFIHYGAFSKNLTINERNVGLYRFLQITRKRGLLGPMDVLTPKAAALLTKLIFGKLRRSRYWPEYGGKK